MRFCKLSFGFFHVLAGAETGEDVQFDLDAGRDSEAAAEVRAAIASFDAAPPDFAANLREEIAGRAAALGRVRVIEFDSRIEKLIVESQGVVGMCGYNTFCEVLSFDKRALMVPRVSPRVIPDVRPAPGIGVGLVSPRPRPGSRSWSPERCDGIRP